MNTEDRIQAARHSLQIATDLEIAHAGEDEDWSIPFFANIELAKTNAAVAQAEALLGIADTINQIHGVIRDIFDYPIQVRKVDR